jgi:hypothetical protein
MSATARGVLLLCAAAAGCGPGGSLGAVPLAATLTLGTVADRFDPDSAFVPLSDGEDVTLVWGAQGGFHVWMKFRASGGPAELTMRKTAYRDSDGKLVLKTFGSAVSIGTPGATGVWELPEATPMFMCPSPIGIRVIDTRIRYEIELDDASGAAVARGRVTLEPHCPPEQSNCEMICVG